MALAFLKNEDVTTHIYQKFIDESQSDFETRLEEVEAQNIDLIKSKFAGKYDTDAIFAKTGTDRSKLIIKYLTMLCIYDLITTNAARKVPEQIEINYERAEKWLNAVRDGKETPDLDLLPIDDTALDIVHGSSINDDYYL
jgi:hypothetical protein